MTNLTQLPKITTRTKKRVGRGYGSGKGGHTSGRGTKGQLSRSKLPLWFEGGQLPLTRRLPFQRGKGRFKTLKKKPIVLNLKYLNLLPKGSRVTIDNLAKHGLVKPEDAKRFGVKILSGGKLDRKLAVSLPTSNAAASAIKAAGGTVTVPSKTKSIAKKTPAKTKPRKTPTKKPTTKKKK